MYVRFEVGNSHVRANVNPKKVLVQRARGRGDGDRDLPVGSVSMQSRSGEISVEFTLRSDDPVEATLLSKESILLLSACVVLGLSLTAVAARMTS